MTKNWVKINDESQITYNEDNQITFKASMLRSSLSDYSDAYILLKGTVTVPNTAAQVVTANNGVKRLIFKNFCFIY